MIDGGPKWKPPNMCMGDGSQLTAAQRGEGIIKRKLLSDLERNRFEDMLARLKADKNSVCEAMVFALNNAEAAEEVVEILMMSLSQPETPVSVKVAHLFVVSDILHNSSASVRNASQYRTRLQESLPDIFESFRTVYESLQNKKDIQEAIKKYVLRVLRIWRSWYIFSNDYLNGLQSTFLAIPQTKADIATGLQKLQGQSADEIERKCRHSGLSLAGGIEQQKLRCVQLDGYIEGNSAQPDQKKPKVKARRTTQNKPPKKDAARSKRASELKTSNWVSVEEEEKKPTVPISQWLQEKQQLKESEPAAVPVVNIQKLAAKPVKENPDFDMFEADDADAHRTEPALNSAPSEEKLVKKPKTG